MGDSLAHVSARLTVVGSINLDLVARAERLPRPGETVTGATFSEIPGGKGANQAVAAARLGATVTLIACVGDDDFATLALAELRAAGVGLDKLKTASVATGVALITVDASGENGIVVAPGANDSCAPRMSTSPTATASCASSRSRSRRWSTSRTRRRATSS